MSQQALLIRVTRALDAAGVEYMLTGSLASSLQGEPRATHDIDLVVALEREAVAGLAATFSEPEFFLSIEAAHDAIDAAGMFNLLDTTEGDKVDFWLLTDDPFDASRFARRQRADVLGTSVWVSSPEDTIVAKLRWAKLSGGSEKQFVDAVRVYELQHAGLDERYLDYWAAILDVADELARLRSEAEPIAL